MSYLDSRIHRVGHMIRSIKNGGRENVNVAFGWWITEIAFTDRNKDKEPEDHIMANLLDGFIPADTALEALIGIRDGLIKMKEERK